MPKHILFVVHGVGVQPAQATAAAPAWDVEVRAKLDQCADPARFAIFAQRKFSDFVDVVPISYDKEFGEALARWKQLGGAASAAHAKSLGLPGAGVLEALADIDPNDAFLWSHVADAALYYVLALERQNVRVSVCDQIVRALKARWQPGEPLPRASIVAHSLGTAVIHDSLHLLATNKQMSQGLPNQLAHPNWGFQTIFMLANTSRVLQTDFNAYESIVRPGPANKLDKYCARYVTVHHEVDPVTLVRRFEPKTWKSLCESITLTHYRDWNVHAFTHFLDNPQVYTQIFSTAISSTALSAKEVANAVDEAEYPRFGGKFANVPKVIAKKNELFSLRDRMPPDPSVLDYFKALKDGIRILRELRDLLA
ncbi:MAG: hypothetical protein HZA52_21040 [Planctomycetes bacterium]|nr:hypothetical protein [Planctomycetota bacterium]